MINSEMLPPLVTFIGPEGAGKTTQRDMLIKNLGGVALQVQTWPALEHFLANPRSHAFDNQQQAMQYTLAAYRTAARAGQPVVADLCPDRVHLVHSWQLHRNGLLSEGELSHLGDQYRTVRQAWGTHYVYLQVDLDTLLERLNRRGLPEDLHYNSKVVDVTLERWESIVADPEWRRGKQVLELDGRQDTEELCQQTTMWVRQTALQRA